MVQHPGDGGEVGGGQIKLAGGCCSHDVIHSGGVGGVMYYK